MHITKGVDDLCTLYSSNTQSTVPAVLGSAQKRPSERNCRDVQVHTNCCAIAGISCASLHSSSIPPLLHYYLSISWEYCVTGKSRDITSKTMIEPDYKSCIQFAMVNAANQTALTVLLRRPSYLVMQRQMTLKAFEIERGLRRHTIKGFNPRYSHV